MLLDAAYRVGLWQAVARSPHSGTVAGGSMLSTEWGCGMLSESLSHDLDETGCSFRANVLPWAIVRRYGINENL